MKCIIITLIGVKMVSEFDRVKYKNIIKINNLKQQDIVDTLHNIYNIDITLGGVKSWTRTTLNSQGEIFQPNLKTLKALADMCNCSIQDFFSDADKKREQIAFEEIKSKPTKYSKSLQSTLSKDLNELLNYYQMLNEDDRHRYLDEIKQTAMKKLHGN